MILLNITNASELIASKVGKFAESITPDFIDQNMVESQVMKTMIDSLLAQGVTGEISLVNGLEIKKEQIVFNNGLAIREHTKF